MANFLDSLLSGVLSVYGRAVMRATIYRTNVQKP